MQSVAITKGAGGTGEIELTATLKTEGVNRRIAGKSVELLSADAARAGPAAPVPAGKKPAPRLPGFPVSEAVHVK